MSKPSRLAQIRADRTLLLGLLAVSAVLLGTIGIRAMNEGNEKAEIARQQADADKRQEDQRKARDRGWIAWRDYAEPLCPISTSAAIKEGLDVTGKRLLWLKDKPLVSEGLIICDSLRVGIVQRKQNRLVITYVVPKKGFTYPLPTTDPPPPEFAPSQPVQ